jgi:hypothetical protein
VRIAGRVEGPYSPRVDFAYDQDVFRIAVREVCAIPNCA